MDTKIYLMRHSKPDKKRFKNCNNPLEKNKSIELDEKYLEKVNKVKGQIKGIKKVYCSDYVRSFTTGKIFDNNIIIDERLGERIGGTPNIKISPQEYFYRQINDYYLKFENGESREEVEKRMYDALMDIIRINYGSKVLIVSHGVSITFLLMKFCDIEIIDVDNKIRRIKYKNQKIFEKNFDYLETFELTFNNNFELIDLKNVNYNI